MLVVLDPELLDGHRSTLKKKYTFFSLQTERPCKYIFTIRIRQIDIYYFLKPSHDQKPIFKILDYFTI